MNRPKVIFFDVNGTLLDMSSLQASIAHALADRKDLFPLWMTTLLHCSLVESAIGSFHEFSDIGAAALRIVAAKNGFEVTDEAAHAAVAPMRSLPAFQDVSAGLNALRDQGFVLAVLTNSASSACTAQMEHAGLAAFFTRQLTVDEIRTYKPNVAVYRWAAEQMRVRPEEALLVAAHGWDLAGAHAAGMQTAFLLRPGQALYPLAPAPDRVARDLIALAASLEHRAAA
jgi:2-haloacid dehalogenase